MVLNATEDIFKILTLPVTGKLLLIQVLAPNATVCSQCSCLESMGFKTICCLV